jgi:hypothetical protein
MKTRNLSHRFADVLAIPQVPTWQGSAHVTNGSRCGPSARQPRDHTRSGPRPARHNSGPPRISSQTLLRHGGDPRFRRLPLRRESPGSAEN